MIDEHSDPRPEAPADPEHDELIAAEEDLPSDAEEFANPPEQDARTRPDLP